MAFSVRYDLKFKFDGNSKSFYSIDDDIVSSTMYFVCGHFNFFLRLTIGSAAMTFCETLRKEGYKGMIRCFECLLSNQL